MKTKERVKGKGLRKKTVTGTAWCITRIERQALVTLKFAKEQLRMSKYLYLAPLSGSIALKIKAGGCSTGCPGGTRISFLFFSHAYCLPRWGTKLKGPDPGPQHLEMFTCSALFRFFGNFLPTRVRELARGPKQTAKAAATKNGS